MKKLLATTKGNTLLYLPWKFDMLGGVDVVVDRLWRGLQKVRPGRALIGIQDWTFEGRCVDQQGRHFLHLNSPGPHTTIRHSSLRYSLTLAKRLPGLLHTLHSQDIKVINAHYPTTNIYPFALLKKMGLWRGRIVLSFHGSDVGEIVPNSRAWQTIADQADAVTACSQGLARRLNDLNLFNQSMQVVYNGIDAHEFVSHASYENFPIEHPYILNVGNFVPRKGQDVLLEAFALVARKYPELQLVFAGGTDNGTWLENLRKIASEGPTADRVHFLENLTQRQVATLMKHATCFAHAARFEAFGLVLIEAGACGTPLIAPQVGGIPEIISSSDFGLLFENGNAADLAEQIDHLLANPPETRKRAASFQQRVVSDFSVEAMLERYGKVLLGEPAST